MARNSALPPSPSLPFHRPQHARTRTHARTYACMHARTYARTHAYTHTHAHTGTIAGVALTCNAVNVIGYVKCKKDARKKLSALGGSVMLKGMEMWSSRKGASSSGA